MGHIFVSVMIAFWSGVSLASMEPDEDVRISITLPDAQTVTSLAVQSREPVQKGGAAVQHLVSSSSPTREETPSEEAQQGSSFFGKIWRGVARHSFARAALHIASVAVSGTGACVLMRAVVSQNPALWPIGFCTIASGEFLRAVSDGGTIASVHKLRPTGYDIVRCAYLSPYYLTTFSSQAAGSALYYEWITGGLALLNNIPLIFLVSGAGALVLCDIAFSLEQSSCLAYKLQRLTSQVNARQPSQL